MGLGWLVISIQFLLSNSYSFPNHFLFNSLSFLFISVPSMFNLFIFFKKVIENVVVNIVNKVCDLTYVLICSESDWEGKENEWKQRRNEMK